MSDIKQCFVSRWGEDGRIIEADFHQLEVIALAFLSDDRQLREDILNKADIHSINAAKLFKRPLPEFLAAKAKDDPITLTQRKLTKQLSFQLQYGAGASSMAEKNNIPLVTAKAFIDTYYSRYPGVKDFQDSIKANVLTNRKVDNELKTDGGYPVGIGRYLSITGRQYVFREYDNPYYHPDKAWTSPTNFSPTQLKNYPVQGFATGDIVPMMLGKVYRRIAHPASHCKMINTVHDSLMFDCKEPWVIDYATIIKEELELAPQYLESEFGIKFDLPLEVEIKVGKNWGELKKLDL